jgi:protein tyrosine phosphatase (PTP) superfamily phosphohydrolase (DUF442 family)
MSTLSEIQNFLQVSPTLATAGQPRRDQFLAISEAGYEAIINLAKPDSPDAVPEEEDITYELGLGYFPIPVAWEHPRPEDLEQFCERMDALNGKKVFVHCARNMRVSAFVFLYRVLRLGEPASGCRFDLEKIWMPNEVWEAFVQESLSGKAGE